MARLSFLLLLLLTFACQKQQPQEEPQTETKQFSNTAPQDARVYFISPKDGDVVDTTFTVRFGLKGMGVAPAGVMQENTGHHHLLIDVQEMPDLSKPLPSTDNIRHFGGGQTQTTLTLKPGEHTLQLVLGNYAHVPHDNPLMSDKITIQVK